MRRCLPELFGILIMLTTGCSLEHNPVVSVAEFPTGGIVCGRIIDDQGIPKAHEIVSIEESRIAVITDTVGDYTFSNLTPAHYRLNVADTSIFVTVMKCDTTRVPDIIVQSDAHSESKSISVGVERLEIRVHHGDEAYTWVDGGSALGMRSPLKLEADNADSIVIRALVVEAELKGTKTRFTPTERLTTVLHNGTMVYESTPGKGRIRTKGIVPTGTDTITIMVEGTVAAQWRIAGDAQAASSPRNHLLVTVQNARLIPFESNSGYYGGSTVVLGADTFWVDYTKHGPIDWDLLLVNNSTTDTCWWHNPNPDWGVPALTNDDPEFSGDYTVFGYYKHDDEDVYSGDCISIYDAAPGTYSVYVRFYNAPSDTHSAMPMITIESGAIPGTSLIERLYQNSPSRPLRKGELWYAGIISIPSGQYDPLDQEIFSLTQSDTLTPARPTNDESCP
ncbi:MAG: hypothetical protein GF344_03825 [Chitinivibrionales bacterium]|nr:hypothetical protein [Chitinivibrionales bacterium]MBD3356184.1 hypothetical protein [Chitinivibrionales bacterium]